MLTFKKDGRTALVTITATEGGPTLVVVYYPAQ